jgi:glutaminyl-peptide cyclotransferase
MKKKYLLLFLAVIAIILVCFFIIFKNKNDVHLESQKTLIEAKEPPKFNADRAWKYLTDQTDFGPRNPNSIGHANCVQYFKETLQKYASSVILQSWIDEGYNEKLHLTNILASFNPEITTRILLCAHWDSRPRAERDPDPKKRNLPILGANDGASGVAILLELATLMKENPPNVGIDIVLFDGEDYGTEGDLSKYFLGARYFVKNKPVGYYPVYGVLLDLVGDKNLKLPKEGASATQYNPLLVNHVWNIAKSLGYNQFDYNIHSSISDDHVILNESGISCINIIDTDLVGGDLYNEERNYWHTHGDTPDKCSKESLKVVGDVLLELIYKKPLL